MILVELIVRVALSVGFLVALGLLSIVGIRRVRRLGSQIGNRLIGAYPYVGLLALILGVNSLVRDYGQEFSWLIDWNITGAIYSIEGELVADIQAYATSELTLLFSSVYVYGYVFLLVFPLLAYLALDDQRHSARHCWPTDSTTLSAFSAISCLSRTVRGTSCRIWSSR